MRWRVICASSDRDTPSIPKVKLACSIGALVADFRQHIDERGGFLIRQLVHDLIDAGRGIAKTGRTGYGPFRIRGIGQQGHMHLFGAPLHSNPRSAYIRICKLYIK